MQTIQDICTQFCIVHTFLLCQIYTQQVFCDEHGGICFGTCYADFRTCPNIYYIITFTSNSTAYHIGNGQYFAAVVFCFSQCCYGIGSFPTLADYDNQCMFIHHWFTITELRCDFYFYRNSCQFFNDGFAYQPCMICGTACHDVNLVPLLHLFFTQFKVKLHFVTMNTACNGFLEYSWLFKDFFQHEMLISIFFCCFRIPLDGVNFFFNHF